MKFIRIVLALLVAGIIAVVALVALIGAGVSQAQKDSDSHGITPAQYRAVKIGTPLAVVEKTLGKPTDHQHTKIQGASGSDCIYYNKVGDMGASYQFCFDAKKLTSKSLY